MDVIALQEAWHAPSREVILETTRRFFPHAHAPDDARCGLVLLSAREFPHARATFAPFKAKSGIEGWWFDKGVTATTLETRGGKRVVVLNAHLQSDFWQPRAETRAKQFPEIVDALADAVRAGGGEDGVDAALLCGDLNVAAGSEEYRAMMKALSGGRERGAADLFERRRGRGRDGDRDRDADAHERERHTFPIARWKHRRWWQRGSGKKSAYVRETPVKRLDYVVDLTRLVRGGGGGGGGWAEAAGGEDEDEEEERGRGRAEVIDGIADDRGAPAERSRVRHRGRVRVIVRSLSFQRVGVVAVVVFFFSLFFLPVARVARRVRVLVFVRPVSVFSSRPRSQLTPRRRPAAAPRPPGPCFSSGIDAAAMWYFSPRVVQRRGVLHRRVRELRDARHEDLRDLLLAVHERLPGDVRVVSTASGVSSLDQRFDLLRFLRERRDRATG